MLDCGNSNVRGRERKGHVHRRCIEGGDFCNLIDEMRYSGRDKYYRKCSRTSKTKLVGMKVLRMDGGTSTTVYTRAPIIDLGTSDIDTIDKIFGPATNVPAC